MLGLALDDMLPETVCITVDCKPANIICQQTRYRLRKPGTDMDFLSTTSPVVGPKLRLLFVLKLTKAIGIRNDRAPATNTSRYHDNADLAKSRNGVPRHSAHSKQIILSFIVLYFIYSIAFAVDTIMELNLTRYIIQMNFIR